MLGKIKWAVRITIWVGTAVFIAPDAVIGAIATLGEGLWMVGEGAVSLLWNELKGELTEVAKKSLTPTNEEMKKVVMQPVGIVPKLIEKLFN
jgi:hypothetical protein